MSLEDDLRKMMIVGGTYVYHEEPEPRFVCIDEASDHPRSKRYWNKLIRQQPWTRSRASKGWRRHVRKMKALTKRKRSA